MSMKYVCSIPNTDKINITDSSKGMDTFTRPFQKGSLYNKCHSNKDLNFEVGEVISNRHICRKKSSYIHFFEICGLHKNGSSACQYILKDIFKFKVVLKLLRHLEKLNVPKFKKWLEGSRRLKSSSWRFQLIMLILLSMILYAALLINLTHHAQNCVHIYQTLNIKYN